MQRMILLWILLCYGGVLSYAVAEELPSNIDIAWPVEYSNREAPKLSAVNYLASRIVDELVLHNDGLRPDQPLVVATPVMVGDMTSVNMLSHQLQQGLMAAMHASLFNLVDLNLARSLRMTPKGDFILTRDWQQLAEDLSVRYVLASTISMDNGGLMVNSRIVDTSNNRVVSVSQIYTHVDELDTYLSPSEKVTSRKGLLYRYPTQGQEQVRMLEDRQ